MIILLPQTMDLDLLVQKILPKNTKYKPNTTLKKDEIAFIYFTILRRTVFTRSDDNDKTRFVNLQSKRLEKITRQYRLIAELLEQEDYISIDGSYIPLERSKGYAINLTKLNPELTEYRITSKKLLKYQNLIPMTISTNPQHIKNLNSWLNKISFDSTKALEWLNTNIKENPVEILTYIANRLIINQFKLKNYYFKIDNTAGRLHTSVTTLKRELRNFITIEGQELEEIDIHNCQPMMSLILFNSELRKDYNLDKILDNRIKEIEEINIPYMFSKFDELSRNQDVQLYYKKVADGQLYNFLFEQFNNSYPDCTITIKELKKATITALYCPSHWENKVANLIKQNFPSIMEAFDLLKKGFIKTKNGKGKMKRKVGDPPNLLAILLQRLESELVLNRIVPEIISTYPEAPIITIHDAILTTSNYIIPLNQIIEQHIQNITNHFKTSSK